MNASIKNNLFPGIFLMELWGKIYFLFRKEPSECYKRFSKFDFLDFGIINQSEENVESSKDL